jgi:hypothetical protein
LRKILVSTSPIQEKGLFYRLIEKAVIGEREEGLRETESAQHSHNKLKLFIDPVTYIYTVLPFYKS